MQQLRNVDRLLSLEAWDSALAVLNPLLRDRGDDWELLYRRAVALRQAGQFQPAVDGFRRLLDLRVPRNQLGRVAGQKRRLASAPTALPGRSQRATLSHQLMYGSQVVIDACGLDEDVDSMARLSPSGWGPGHRPFWAPEYYGVARMAAFGWLMKLQRELQKDDPRIDLLADRRFELPANDESTRRLIDRLSISALEWDEESAIPILLELARRGGRDEKSLLLQMVNSRFYSQAEEPLAEKTLTFVLTCFRELQSEDKVGAAQNPVPAGAYLIPGGGMYYLYVGGNAVAVGNVTFSSVVFLPALCRELQLAGREEEAESLVQAYIDTAVTSHELYQAIRLISINTAMESDDSLEEGSTDPPSERELHLYHRWIAALAQELRDEFATATSAHQQQMLSRDPLVWHNDLLTDWFSRLHRHGQRDTILTLLTPALDLLVEQHTATRRLVRQQPARSYSGSRHRQEWGFNIRLGDDYRYVQETLPAPGHFASASQLILLRSALEYFRAAEDEQKLLDYLQQRVDRAQEDTRPMEQLMQSWIALWRDEQESAVRQITQVATDLPGDAYLQIELARLHYQLENDAQALEHLDSIDVLDRSILRQREIMALTIAERAGHVERARQAAERLFGLRLDTEEQIGLANVMRRLGLSRMAEKILARLHRSGGNREETLLLLMSQYQSQGQTDLACEIAHRILLSTRSALQTSSRWQHAHSAWQSASAEHPARTEALRTLHQAGQLQAMEQRLTALRRQAPQSSGLIGQLLEIYRVTDQTEKLSALIASLGEPDLDDPATRLQLARQYQQSGEADAACDHYLELLKQRPGWVCESLGEVQEVFEQGQRTDDLLQALIETDINTIQQNDFEVIDLACSQFAGTPAEQISLAAELLKRLAEADASSVDTMFYNVHDPDVLAHPQVNALARSLLLLSADSGQGWTGVDRDQGNDSDDGTVSVMFQLVINAIDDDSRRTEFRNRIRRQLKSHPSWQAGQLMLALMDLHQGEEQQGRTALVRLVEAPGNPESLPSTVCHLIAQELRHDVQTWPLAEQLLLQAQKNSDDDDHRSGPVLLLLQLYQSHGQPEKTRELLLSIVPPEIDHRSSEDYEQAQWVTNQLWVSEQLLTHGFSLESLSGFQRLMNSPIDLTRVAPWWEFQDRSIDTRVSQGMQTALAKLAPADREQAIHQLLRLPDRLPPDQVALDLMMDAPRLPAAAGC